ncbi:zinc finger CCCH domain-containing protein 62-like [Humulus lupulus]|uniref:zinc finger CCCH domain-containing protein 62-like n=1 Tax=Humulus lupulus TaxID=3486 RepID=UPI002B405B6A|nr:zinc finger CCCH domain-containing protein 62-like [Humulus lupulus]
MAEREGKRLVVCLSSSSDDDDAATDYVDLEDDDDDDYDEDESEEGSDSDSEHSDQKQEDEEDNNGHGVDVDVESLCNNIVRLLKEHDELKSLKLKDCKAYLRKHGLRVAGTKSVCIQRIKEHWRLMDGNGEALYPSSSFVINCTGDVCKGDVVLFTQKVFERFDKVTRHGKVLGERTVAGRVVKESYGAAKQQHTFTVEVVWSRGFKKLTPLYPLLVKGRNLYKMRTFRQRWSDEGLRLNVLAEKHKRGAAARLERAMKRTKNGTANRGTKDQKKISSAGLSRKRKASETKKRRDNFDRRGKDPVGESSNYNSHRHHDPTFRSFEHFREYRKFSRPITSNDPNFQSHTDPPWVNDQSQIRSQYRSAAYPISRPRSSDTCDRMPGPQFERFDHTFQTNHASLNPGYNFESRNWSGFLGPYVHRPTMHPFIPGTDGQRR